MLPNQSFGEICRAARKDLRLTLRAAGEDLRTSASYLTKVEHDRVLNISAAILLKLQEFYGFPDDVVLAAFRETLRRAYSKG